MEIKIQVLQNKQVNFFALNNNKGFTLIELLVVIAIIALLASVVLVSLSSARQKSRDASRIATLNQFSKAMELYFNTNLSYPTVSAAATVYCVIGSANCLTNLVPGYLAKIPVSPLPADSSSVLNCGNSYNAATANDYQYAGTGVGANTSANYTITFCLGGPAGSLSAGAHTLTQSAFQ